MESSNKSSSLKSSCVCGYVLILLIIHVQLTQSATIFGYVLRNPSSSDQAENDDTNSEHELADLVGNDQPSSNYTSTLSNIRCSKNEDCQKDKSINFFCDSHYGFCDVRRIEMELCRRDEQCDKNLICMFGKCQREPKPGNKGSRCKSDSDCKSHMCCARQHGEKVCKPKLQRNQRCYVPTGGLDYSLNELCPCDSGLVCSKKKKKNTRKDSQALRSTINQMRCQRIPMSSNE